MRTQLVGRKWGIYPRSLFRTFAFGVTLGLAATTLSACSSAPTRVFAADKIAAIGAESQYADIISQIGGQHVDVRAIMSNPNVDPHSFEASPSIASEIDQAQLIVQNGLGYDGFMEKLEDASMMKNRHVVNAQNVLSLPDSTYNPHLWFNPTYMITVAEAIEKSLAKIDPSHATDYAKNLGQFRARMTTLLQLISTIEKNVRDAPVAVSEPVANYLLDAVGVKIMTPHGLQTAMMNGVDPSAQDLAQQQKLLVNNQVKAYIYNKQVINSATTRSLNQATCAGIPVIAVYEIMPVGFTYESWMTAEVAALNAAITTGSSRQELL